MSFEIINNDVRAGLRQVADNSISTVVTSPPYWGLRAYQTIPQVWGGDADCEHVWGAEASNAGNINAYKTGGQFCQLCGAWRGELGSEPTMDLFVSNLVEVFREVKRVLHPTGTVFLNLGDSYAGSGHGYFSEPKGKQATNKGTAFMCERPPAVVPQGLKAKDMCLIPFRVALGLQSDGWYLRSLIPWVKRNAMPESTQDRPGQAVEYWLMLTKKAKYFYDNEAVKIKSVCFDTDNRAAKGRVPHKSGKSIMPDCQYSMNGVAFTADGQRNRRNSDWYFDSLRAIVGGASIPQVDDDGQIIALPINSQGTSVDHYATYPTRLIEPLIKAGSSERGICSKCGAPWERVVEKGGTTTFEQLQEKGYSKKRGAGGDLVRQALDYAGGHGSNIRQSTTLGWRPTCACNADVVPARVLDIFSGTGTTGVVALELGRDYIGIELNPKHAKYSEKRLAKVMPLFG